MKTVQRERQVKKIFNEFKNDRKSLNKIFGIKEDVKLNKKNMENIDFNKFYKNKSNYESFKKRVSSTRRYNKERETIKKEMNAYRNKLNNKNKYETQKMLHSVYGENTGIVYAKKDILNITMADIRKGEKSIKNKVAKGLMNTLTEEMQYDKGKTGAFFKNTSEERGVEEKLKELENLVKQDNNAIKNMNIIYNYLYEKIIPLRYENEMEVEGVEQYNTESARAPIGFFRDTASKILNKYKEITRK